MAIVLDQICPAIEVTGTGGSIVLTFPTAPASGALVVVGISQWDSTYGITNVTDNQGNTYYEAITKANAATSILSAIYYAKNVTSSGTFIITVNIGTAGTDSAAGAVSYTGVDTTNPTSGCGTNLGLGTTPDSGSMTQANNAVYFANLNYAAATTSSSTIPWNQRFVVDNAAFAPINAEDLFSTGSQIARWTIGSSTNYVASIAAFKEATSTSAIVDASVSLGGIGNLTSTGQIPSNIDLSLEYTVLAATTRTNTTLIKPNNTVDGDFLLALIYIESSSIAVTAPDGWNLICSSMSSGSSFRNILYYKRASGEPADWTWTHVNTTPGFTCGYVKRFTGVVASGDPEDCTRTVNVGSSTTPIWDAVTTLTDGAALIGIEGNFVTASRRTLSTLTERIDGDDVFLQADLKGTAGNSGSLGATDSSTGEWIAQLLALKPTTSASSGSPSVLKDVIFIWPGSASTIPSGWSRVTSLDGIYPLGASSGSDPNTTGGSNIHVHTTGTHTHSGSAHIHTVPNSGSGAGNTNRDTGTVRPPTAHTHYNNPSTVNPTATTGSQAPTSGSVSLEPDFYSVIYIKSDGTTDGLSGSIVGLWNNNTSTPSGFALADGSGGRPDLRNKFLRGALTGGDSGSTSGSAGHSHTIDTHTHSDNYAHAHPTVTSASTNTAMVGGPISGTAVQTATQAHTHVLTIASQATDAITTNTDTAQFSNNEPPYIKQAFIQNTGSISLPVGIIGLWTGSLSQVPANWVLCTGGSGTPDLRDKFIKSASALGEIGLTGGSLTHTHTVTGHNHAIATHDHTISHANGAGTTETAGAVGCATTAHTHSWANVGASGSFLSTSTTPTISTNSSLPAYYTVAYIQYQGSGSGVTTVSGSTILTGNTDLSTIALNNILSLISLAGNGNLTLSSLVTLLNVISLNGTGNLSLSSLINILAQTILSGKDDISSLAVLLIAAIATLTGNSDISSIPVLTIFSNTILNGIGSLLATALEQAATISGSAILTGSLDTSLNALNTLIGQLAIEGKGSIDAQSLVIALLQSIMSGRGDIQANVLLLISTLITLVGNGDLSTISLLTTFGTTSLSGTGLLASSGLISILANASISAKADLLTTALQIADGRFIADGNGTLNAQSLINILAQSIVSGQGNIQSSATLLIAAILTLTGNGDLSLSAINSAVANAILNANGTLTSIGLNNILSAGVLSGNGDLITSSLIIIQSLISLLGSGDISNTSLPFLTIPSNAILNAFGYLFPISFIQGLVDGSVILSANGDLIISALNLITAQPVLSGQGNLSISALNQIFGQTTLSGQGILLLEILLAILGQSILSGQVTNQAEAKILIDSLTNLTGRLDLLPVGFNTNLSSTVLTGELTNLASALLVISTLSTLIGNGNLDVASTIIIPSFTTLSGIASLLAISTVEGLVDALAILSGQGNLTLSALNAINAQLALYASGDLNVLPVLNISAFSSLNGIAFLIATGTIEIITNVVTGSAILAGRGDLILSALNLVNGETITTGQAILSTQALVNVLSNAILSGQGNTQAYATLLVSAIGALYAAGAIIPIGTIPSGILLITPLSRTYIIRGEDRIFVIDDEGRIFLIDLEDRGFSIDSEKRILVVNSQKRDDEILD